MTGRGLLLDELEWISGNCCRLLGMAKPEHMDWRPQEGMRTLAEVANHLAQIPSVDLRIMKGDSEQEIKDLEQSLMRQQPQQWCEELRGGVITLRHFIETLSLDDYENGSGMAFYGRTQTYANWLLEVVTHMYHHRAQLFMYLKLNGYKVDTSTLYG